MTMRTTWIHGFVWRESTAGLVEERRRSGRERRKRNWRWRAKRMRPPTVWLMTFVSMMSPSVVVVCSRSSELPVHSSPLYTASGIVADDPTLVHAPRMVR
jgi:hypothetical protein